MKRFLIKLTVALATFLLGTTAANIPYYFESQEDEASAITLEERAALPRLEQSRPEVEQRLLSPEEAEVVEGAEYFVCFSGYTHQQCGGIGRVYVDPDESSDDCDQVWAKRRDTLEGRAYGLSRMEKGNSTFWTVVFRYTERAGERREKFGRAYIVEDHHGRYPGQYFVGFRHNFPLAKVQKRL